MKYSDAFQKYIDTGDRSDLLIYYEETKDEGGILVPDQMVVALNESKWNRKKFIELQLKPDGSNKKLLEAYADWFRLK